MAVTYNRQNWEQDISTLVDSHEQRIANFESTTEAGQYAEILTKLQDADTQLQSNIDTVDAKVNTNTENIATNLTAINANKDSIDALTTTVANNKTSSESGDSALQTQIDTVNGTLTRINNTLKTIKATTYKRVTCPSVTKTTVTIPAYTKVAVGDKEFINDADISLSLDNFISASDRAGKDLYIYACDNNGTLTYIISANSTVPTDYTASTSRKIGGFHCLCADVGTISGHTLSGYVAGDILPLSIWDLLHRAVSENEGMVYVNGKWIDIYLSGWDGSQLVSAFGATVADGDSSVKFHGEKFVEYLGLVRKQLIDRDTFVVAAKGSNEQTNIYGSSDVGTAGGHRDTSSRRMISNYGLEDCCGLMWQWTKNLFEHYPNSTWGGTSNSYLDGYSRQQASVYDSNADSQGYGSCVGFLRRCVVGGYWGDGANCGSRGADCDVFSSSVRNNVGGRAVSEPRVVNL